MFRNYDAWKATDHQYEADERRCEDLRKEAIRIVANHIEWIKQDYGEDKILYMDEEGNLYNKEEFIKWSIDECDMTKEDAYQGLDDWTVDWEAYEERLIEEYIDKNW